jgi:hypothetical protein
MPSDWNGKLKKEEFVDFSRIMVAVNPTGGGIVACHTTGVIRVPPEEPFDALRGTPHSWVPLLFVFR